MTAAISTAGAWSIIIIGVLAYFIPTYIVLIRKKREPWPTIVVNVLLGWSMIGWVVSLAMSLSNQHGYVAPHPEFAAGWYPDAAMPGTMRWWDGQRWTMATQPSEMTQS